MTIKGMLEKVRTVNLRAEVPEIILRTSSEILELNKQQLYQEGIRSDGITLREYRNFDYAAYKHSLNPAPGPGIPDLYLEGSYYRGFQVFNITSRSFDINSTDSKAESLEERFGEQVYGLTQKSRKVYALGVFFDGIKAYITGKTGLRFK